MSADGQSRRASKQNSRDRTASKSHLPPLRALQAFDAFGRLGSVNEAARELGVTPGAISQQIKILEAFVNFTLVLKDGRRATLTPNARIYHQLVTQGFAKLRQAQDYLVQQNPVTDLTISGLPTLLLKWLNPSLHRFQVQAGGISVRLEATHTEPNPQLLGRMFRLTYGANAQSYSYSRRLFTDICFPVCSPDLLERNPNARDAATLARLPLIEIDWGTHYAAVPHWHEWFESECIVVRKLKPVAVYSLSGLALEAAINGQGVTLAQASFAAVDLETKRLVRLSPKALSMPEPYFICWGPSTFEQAVARDFFHWIMDESRELRDSVR